MRIFLGKVPSPDGDTVKFLPDTPGLVETLRRPSGRPPDINSHGISVRLEAIGALETHLQEPTKSTTPHIVRFSEQGANALLGTVMTLATLSLVVPSFTSSSEGPTFSGSQLAFSAIASAAVYGIFVFVQTGRHRWMFVVPEAAEPPDATASVPARTTVRGDAIGPSPSVGRIAMLLVSLLVVVGPAKTLAPSIERAVVWAGTPQSFVGVVIAIMVLLPESIAAVRAAARNEMQTSLNLALGSGLASIGLTIPAIAVASIWLEGPIVLGLGGKEIVFLVLTTVVCILTFGSGRATVLQATHHLAVFAAFLFLAVVP